MPLPVPNLDDRTFDQLVAEARGLIPKYFPKWTDYNPSDPGITLLELFAFLVEAAVYQINRVPERSLEHFARLVGVTRLDGEPIETTLRRALEALTEINRAITEEEFEILAKQAGAIHDMIIARAKVIVEVINTPNVFPNEQFVKVAIMPDQPESIKPKPTPELRQKVFEFLRSRCLIATRVQVIEPVYTDVSIDVTVVRDLSSRLSNDTVRQNVEQAVRNFLSPFTGGAEDKGWEFGRPVFRSELYQVIEGIDGVDHVKRLRLNGSDSNSEVALESPTSLVWLEEQELMVTVVDL